jgi:hypothetical protein
VLRPVWPALVLAIHCIATTLALAQTAPKADSRFATMHAAELAVSKYYEQPFEILEFLTAWEGFGHPGPEGTMGFLAGVFDKHPERIAAVINAKLNDPMQKLVINALRLAGRTAEAKRAAEQWKWPAEEIAKIPPTRRPLSSVKPQTPGQFDVFWGASFGTGDAIYVRPIYDYYVAVVTQQGVDAPDLITVVLSRFQRDKSGMEAVSKKYPRDTLVRVVYASSALWSLDSNAHQHKFVAAALEQYAKEAPDSAATATLKEMRRHSERLRRPR